MGQAGRRAHVSATDPGMHISKRCYARCSIRSMHPVAHVKHCLENTPLIPMFLCQTPTGDGSLPARHNRRGLGYQRSREGDWRGSTDDGTICDTIMVENQSTFAQVSCNMQFSSMAEFQTRLKCAFPKKIVVPLMYTEILLSLVYDPTKNGPAICRNPLWSQEAILARPVPKNLPTKGLTLAWGKTGRRAIFSQAQDRQMCNPSPDKKRPTPFSENPQI